MSNYHINTFFGLVFCLLETVKRCHLLLFLNFVSLRLLFLCGAVQKPNYLYISAYLSVFLQLPESSSALGKLKTKIFQA